MNALKQPPWLETAEGKMRRVGVELEMSGLELDALAECVAGFFDLEIKSHGRYERVLEGDPAGDWIVELDYDLLKRLGRETHADDTLEGDLGRAAEGALAWAAEAIVPVEVVGPPLPLARLGEVEGLIAHLREAGAKGTSDSLVNAFGMQFNPEVPATDSDTIAAYLKAFLCLSDWLVERADINFARRVTSYVDPFPSDYIRKVIASDYRPDLSVLIDDYLAENPTRNRMLDMLPLFLHLDEERVRKVTQDPLVKARPTFHYRLPDCEIHKPDWGLYLAWNDWVEVERLAADTARLNGCCAAYRNFLDRPIERLLDAWKDTLEAEWLERP
ncbi:amidoligase family protein [Thiocapsa bogorovii]|uniref:amidoligase family protein n=1 Tax=Thiocapsa bogorovii TaxID=521689 RepID=UPI001E4D93BB|nr:amidoligase family protein [Thiocapsa bogorovii]UHD16571.1 amidoligase family protein [Thiocapsa bogorovii]